MTESTSKTSDKQRVVIYLYHPDDFFGDTCTWRLESSFSHSAIGINGFIYSAIFPHAVKMPMNAPMDNPHRHELGIPPRTGEIYTLHLTKEQAQKAQEWCEAHLKSRYDLLSLVGWALRIQALQSPHTFYCFEYVHSALVYAGCLPVYRSFITGYRFLRCSF